jgi:hypothetical protein
MHKQTVRISYPDRFCQLHLIPFGYAMTMTLDHDPCFDPDCPIIMEAYDP